MWCRLIVDSDFERTNVTFGGSNVAFHDWKLGDPRRCDRGLGLDQHCEVELIFEQIRRFDDALILAVKQHDTFARERHERNFRHWLSARGDQCSHFWSSPGRIFGPATRLTNVDKARRCGASDLVGNFAEQGCFLSACDRNWFFSGSLAEAVELRAAKLPAFNYFGAATGTSYRFAIKRHGVFAGADKYGARPFGHQLINLFVCPGSQRNAVGHSPRSDPHDRGTGLGTCIAIVICIQTRKVERGKCRRELPFRHLRPTWRCRRRFQRYACAKSGTPLLMQYRSRPSGVPERWSMSAVSISPSLPWCWNRTSHCGRRDGRSMPAWQP